CSSLRTVVYPTGLACSRDSWTSRTVHGPRCHNTRRISSSAFVGARFDIGSLCTKLFVPTPGGFRRFPVSEREGCRACATGREAMTCSRKPVHRCASVRLVVDCSVSRDTLPCTSSRVRRNTKVPAGRSAVTADRPAGTFVFLRTREDVQGRVSLLTEQSTTRRTDAQR